MYLLAVGVVVILNLFLGFVAFTKNSRSSTNRLFLLLTFIVSSWAITNYMSVQTLNPDEVIFWLRPIMVATGGMFAVIFLLSKSFPSSSIGLPQYLTAVIVIFTIFVQILAATPLVFERVVVRGSLVTPVPGPAMPIFAANVLGFLLLTLLVLFKKYRAFKGLEKIQLQYLIFGITLTFLLGTLTNFIFVIALNITSFVAIGPLFSLILVTSIAYAIVRHRFLDIRLVVARTVAYSLLVLLFAFFYGFVLFIAGNILFGASAGWSQLVASTILALLMAFSFQPLQRYLEKVTDRLFFKGRYDAGELLGELSHIMASTFSLTDLASLLLKELFSQMRISYGFIVLTKDSSIIWVKGAGKEEHPEFDEKKICDLIQKAAKNEEPVLIFDELGEGEAKDAMRQHGINVVLPLIAEGSIVGALLLGEKASGEVYTVEDVRVLKIVAPEGAVAIKNALSYEEIKQFNVTLQEEIERATSDLKSANEKLTELDKLKDEFVSLASHELRTPMTAIKGSLSTILDGYAGEISGESRDFLTAAYNENDRLIRLVNNLLNISRIEAGRFTFTISDVDLVKVAKDVVENMQMAAKEKGITLTLEPDGLIPNVKADEDKVREVFINFIGNAIKFTKEGGVSLRVAQKDAMVVVSVTDTGPGIAKEDQDLLFKKFSQVGGSYSKPGGGTGLGLYISKQIIEGLGGKIWLESEIGKGSIFSFSLPIVQ